MKNEAFNKKNYDKLIRYYYIYKNQYKKYGLTFYIKEEEYEYEEEEYEYEEEEEKFPNKIIFYLK